MKKIVLCLLIIMFSFVSFSGIYAVEDTSILDIKSTNDVYKFSEDKEIKLPFIRTSLNRMIMDKDLSKSGMSISTKNITATNNLKGIQTLISEDTIRVEGNMEYGVLIAPTVIIEGTIDKTVVVMAKNITVSEGAVIKEDLLAISTDLDILGSVEGNVLGSAKSLNVSGNISEDLRFYVDEINLDEASTISGSIYLSSYNDIDLGDRYPNAIINTLEKPQWYELIYINEIIISSILFALIYLLVASKTSIFKNILNKVKSNKVSVPLYGALSIILVPVAFLLFILLLYIGTIEFAFAFAITYTAFMIVVGILSTFIVGSVMCEHIISKYGNIKGFFYKFVFTLCVFLALSLITKLPYVNELFGMLIFLSASGIVLTSLIKKAE